MSKFAKNVLKLLSATTLTQILTIIISPIIARNYGPSAYGTAALISSIANLLALVFTGRYQNALYIPKSDRNAKSLLYLSFILAFLFLIITFPIFFFGKEFWANLLKNKYIISFAFIIPILAFVISTGTSITNYLVRRKKFWEITFIRLASFLGITISLFVGIYLGKTNDFFKTLTIVIGAISGFVFAVIFGFQFVFKNTSGLEIKNLLWVGKRYRRFPLLDMPTAFVSSFSFQLPFYILSSFFSSNIVGFYSLSLRMVKLPMQTIGQSISQVLIQKIGQGSKDSDIKNTVIKLVSILFKISFFPSLILIFYGGSVFQFVFGDQWFEAGFYVQIMALWMFVWFMASPLGQVFIVKEKQSFFFKWNLINTITRTIMIFLGGFLGAPRLSILLFSLGGVVMYLILLISTFLLLKINPILILNEIYQTLIKSIILLTIPISLSFIFTDNLIRFFIVVFSFLIFGLIVGIPVYKEIFIKKVNNV